MEPRTRRPVLVIFAALAVVVATAIAILEIANAHAWDGPAPLVALTVGMAAMFLITGAAQSPAVWLGCVGVFVFAIGAGVGRRPSTVFVYPYQPFQPDIWTPVLAAGVLLILSALVWALIRIRRGVDRLPHVPVAMIGLLLMSGGFGGAIFVLRSVVLYPMYPHPFTGRPIRRNGKALAGTLAVGTTTASSAPWVEAASHEASAVTAFAELAARLRAVGAPEALVAQSLRASRDEARHTRLCDRIAASLGAASQPTAIPPADVRVYTHSHASRQHEILRLALESFVDGVVGEGYSAACLVAGSLTIDAPKSAAVLRAIAEDEQRHATLGADIVHWCCSMSPAIVSRGLRWSARQIPQTTAIPESHRGLDADALMAAGLPDEATSQALWIRTRDSAMEWLSDLLQSDEPVEGDWHSLCPSP